MANETRKQRESNLELFRIVTMLLIIAHHYVVNSGLLAGSGPVRADANRFRALFTIVFGAWGKTGINCFVLISGYFMCRSRITLKKFAKLLFEYMFYKIVIAAIFLITGYDSFTLKDFLTALIPIDSIDSNFVPCYLIFFLCIPFLNILTSHMNEVQHILITLIGLFTYSFLGFFRVVTMNYVSWFIVVYFVASYIRLYPKPVYSNRRFVTAAFFLSALVSLLSIGAAIKLRGRYGINSYYYFLSDSNTPLALLTAICAFLFFKNLPVPESRIINTLGGTTFGVLLIHSMNEPMRHFLWDKCIRVVHSYSHDWFYLSAIGSVLLLFIVCSFIDMLRIRFLEKPFFARWDKMLPSPEERLKSRFLKLCEKLKSERS